MKKVLALVLAAIMALALIGCANTEKPAATEPATEPAPAAEPAAEPAAPEAKEYTGIRHITIFENNIGGMTAATCAWGTKGTTYEGYSLSEYAANNFVVDVPDTEKAMYIAYSDGFAATGDAAAFKTYNLAITDNADAKGRIPILCGETVDTKTMPFNIGVMIVGDEAIISTASIGGALTMSQYFEYGAEMNGFAEAEAWDVYKTDGSMETVATADLDGVDISGVQYLVPTGMAVTAPAGAEAPAEAPAAKEYTGIRHVTVFENNLDGMTAATCAWGTKGTTYEGYSLSEYAANNFVVDVPDTEKAMYIAYSDGFAATGDAAAFKTYNLAITDNADAKGRIPILCGETVDTKTMPFNIGVMIVGDEAIISTASIGGALTMSQYFEYGAEMNGFAEAEAWDFYMVDGSMKTVATADLDSVDLSTVKCFVPTGAAH